MRTLKPCLENQLFILDDFGYDGRGAYYLGKNGGNEIESACKNLINKIIEMLGAKKIVFCGTSKGAWAALNLMTSFDNSIAIVGSPQYKLGDYLMIPAHETTRKYVLSGSDFQAVDQLNVYLKNKLEFSNPQRHKIYLHYSDSEHTYQDHIKFLIEDLNQYGYPLENEVKHYTDHWDVGKHYPEFLIRCLKKESYSLKV